MFIPIHPDERIPVEIDGVTFFVKPLTGETGNTWYFMFKKYRALVDSGDKSDEAEKKIIEMESELFDFIVIGWESVDKKIAAFPEDNKPSKMFNHFDINELVFGKFYTAARGLSIDEKKSS